MVCKIDKWWCTGPWFNIKMLSYQYRKSHCGDKTVVRSSYLHNGISYTGKMSSLYWIGALVAFLITFINYDLYPAWPSAVIDKATALTIGYVSVSAYKRIHRWWRIQWILQCIQVRNFRTQIFIYFVYSNITIYVFITIFWSHSKRLHHGNINEIERDYVFLKVHANVHFPV